MQSVVFDGALHVLSRMHVYTDSVSDTILVPSQNNEYNYIKLCTENWRRPPGQPPTTWRTFMIACLRWILGYMRLEIRRKIILSEDWCLCTVLHTRACYYWIGLELRIKLCLVSINSRPQLSTCSMPESSVKNPRISYQSDHVYCNSHCDIQPWAQLHSYQVNSDFYSLEC